MLALLILIGCGALNAEERCAQSQRASTEAWEKVAGYYERTGELLRAEQGAAAANVASAAALRGRASRSAAAARSRSTSGLTDLRTGKQFKDPAAASRQRAEARSASAKAAGHAEAALLHLVDLASLSDRIDARLAKASVARQFTRENPTASQEAWQLAARLSDTELADRARAASVAARMACPASD